MSIKYIISEGRILLCKLKMELPYKSVCVNQSSRLQGVLMEHISEEYADILHEQGLKPYSQAVIHDNGRIFWVVNTLNE